MLFSPYLGFTTDTNLSLKFETPKVDTIWKFFTNEQLVYDKES
jgi:hypothetical protein